jgi:YidC/Oxa1 family membrane protein insertase
MEMRRFLYFISVIVIGLVYVRVIMPYFHPEWFVPPVQQNVVENQLQNPDDANTPTGQNPADKPQPEGTPKVEETIKSYPASQVSLGSLDPETGYYISVDLTTRGASIASAKLNDKRYRSLEDTKSPLQILGASSAGDNSETFSVRIPAIDAQLIKHRTSVAEANWGIDEVTKTNESVTFFYDSPDGQLRAEKTFSLIKGENQFRDTAPGPYTLNVSLRIINKSDLTRSIRYFLQAPTGVPLEDPDNARRYLELQQGYITSSGSLHYLKTTAQELVTQNDKAIRHNNPELIDKHTSPVKFIGVDDSYFVALLMPTEDQKEHGYFASVAPELLKKNVDHPERSDISATLESKPMEISAKAEVKHDFKLYIGPKRTELLRPLGAEDLMQHGWFGWVARSMLWLMSTLHDSIGLPYWLAIIMLTVIVRGAMYPLSRKQALSMKHFKDLQPHIAALQKKYENDKEKLAVAQMELMRDHGVSPLMGCMPFMLIMFQMPIFIGLYNALANSVDLRMAPFLYITNLAAPDKLFQLPFSIPMLGHDFNLLPILTIGLFMLQQKMYMPPAASEEQKMQQQMMSFMTIFMGVMFYKVPAGLCVYFIASSIWGLIERKILEKHDDLIEKRNLKKKAMEGNVIYVEAGGAKVSPEPAKPTWFSNIMAQLNEAANPQEKGGKTLTKAPPRDQRNNNKK